MQDFISRYKTLLFLNVTDAAVRVVEKWFWRSRPVFLLSGCHSSCCVTLPPAAITPSLRHSEEPWVCETFPPSHLSPRLCTKRGNCCCCCCSALCRTPTWCLLTACPHNTMQILQNLLTVSPFERVLSQLKLKLIFCWDNLMFAFGKTWIFEF